MKLVFIHGAPGSGKLTTARALLNRLDGRLFDNHAAIDLARTVFDFGAPGFWELVQTVRTSVLSAATERGVPFLVMPFVYVEPDDLANFEEFEVIVQRRDGQLLPVFLQCSTSEIVRRIGNPERIARRRWRPNRVRVISWRGTRSLQFRDRTASYLTARPMMRTRTLNTSFGTSLSPLDSRMRVQDRFF